MENGTSLIVEARFVAVTVISSRMLSCALAIPDIQKTTIAATTEPMQRADVFEKRVVFVSLIIALSPQTDQIHVELTAIIDLSSAQMHVVFSQHKRIRIDWAEDRIFPAPM